MEFELNQAISTLSKTPQVLQTLLTGAAEDWTHNNEGEHTWSAFDIVGHLIHGEKTDWMVRTHIILSEHTNDKLFEPFDRFAQFTESKGQSLSNLLETFEKHRAKNLKELQELNIIEAQLDLIGEHPELGKVTLRQLLSSWVVHDLGHIAQIARVMAKQYKANVGPWKAYLSILNR